MMGTMNQQQDQMGVPARWRIRERLERLLPSTGYRSGHLPLALGAAILIPGGFILLLIGSALPMFGFFQRRRKAKDPLVDEGAALPGSIPLTTEEL
ncbi:MAG: hypothetical protein HY650_12645 [Acidobacteria bacterium]|nr:hypothetical protein [Acidobacteriota bacterium]